ncbi:phosphotransferase [Geminicoccaceae bacterium 1502E]|nr:phosphotransferase [Geminicoccaceae bacterium 1502E]
MSTERFLARAGWPGARRLPLAGDASGRRYERVSGGGHSVVLMESGEVPIGPFLAIARWLREEGIHAPAVLAADELQGLALLEDLGDGLLPSAIEGGASEAELYEAVLALVLHMQARPAPSFLPPLDAPALLAQLDLFLEFAVPLVPAGEAEAFRAAWRAPLEAACSGPQVFVHRDFHAMNLLWLPRETGLGRLGVIDFQDAFCGPAAYDVVSLLQDARRDVAPAVVRAFLQAYAERRPVADHDAFAASLAILGAQRAMRILGVFARLERRGRTGYASLVPRVRRHLDANLLHPALAGIRAWCERHLATERAPDRPAAGTSAGTS